jgi:hypothetical protein
MESKVYTNNKVFNSKNKGSRIKGGDSYLAQVYMLESYLPLVWIIISMALSKLQVIIGI